MESVVRILFEHGDRYGGLWLRLRKYEAPCVDIPEIFVVEWQVREPRTMWSYAAYIGRGIHLVIDEAKPRLSDAQAIRLAIKEHDELAIQYDSTLKGD